MSSTQFPVKTWPVRKSTVAQHTYDAGGTNYVYSTLSVGKSAGRLIVLDENTLGFPIDQVFVKHNITVDMGSGNWKAYGMDFSGFWTQLPNLLEAVDAGDDGLTVIANDKMGQFNSAGIQKIVLETTGDSTATAYVTSMPIGI